MQTEVMQSYAGRRQRERERERLDLAKTFEMSDLIHSSCGGLNTLGPGDELLEGVILLE